MLVNRSIPTCTVIPELAYSDVGAAIDWLCNVFGFTLRIRIGNHRAQLNVGDGAMVVIELPSEEQSATRVGRTHSVMVRVEDAQRHHDKAKARGARILRPPADYPYGERQYTAEDFGGHIWTFTQSIVDVDPRDWGGTRGSL